MRKPIVDKYIPCGSFPDCPPEPDANNDNCRCCPSLKKREGYKHREEVKNYGKQRK